MANLDIKSSTLFAGARAVPTPILEVQNAAVFLVGKMDVTFNDYNDRVVQDGVIPLRVFGSETAANRDALSEELVCLGEMDPEDLGNDDTDEDDLPYLPFTQTGINALANRLHAPLNTRSSGRRMVTYLKLRAGENLSDDDVKVILDQMTVRHFRIISLTLS